MKAPDHIDETHTPPHVEAPLGLQFPIVVNAVLLIATAMIIIGGVLHYQRASRIAIAFENRFITTEWRLLSQLKAETDRLLAEKDREIAFLRQQYDVLVDRGGTEIERAEVNRAIERAYAEREDILVKRITAPIVLAGGSAQADDTNQRGEAPPGGRNGSADIAADIDTDADLATVLGIGTGTNGQAIDVRASTEVLPELFSSTDSQALVWYRRGIDELLDIGEGDVLARLDASQSDTVITDVPVADLDRLRALAGLAAQRDVVRREVDTLRSREQTLTQSIQRLQTELSVRDDRIAALLAERAELMVRLEEVTDSGRRVTDTARTDLEEEVATLDRENRRIVAERRELQNDLDRLERENRRLAAEVSALRTAAQEAAIPDTTTPETANADATRARQDAYQAGFIAGVQEGRAEGRENGLADGFVRGRAEGFQDGLQEGRATGRSAAFGWISTAMRYLSGGSVSNTEEVREGLVTQWLEDGGLREILIQTQRLSANGIPSDRDTLPRLSLLGVVATVQGARVRVEMITERPVTVGERVEVRSRGDTPPGDLKASATVVARIGTLVQLEIVGEPARPLARDDLVYSIVLP